MGSEKMFEKLTSKKYKAVPDCQEGQTETLLPDSEKVEQHPKRGRSKFFLCCICLLLLASLGLAALLGAWVGSRWQSQSDSVCAARASQYSPIQKDVDITYNYVRFNGSFLKENIFRQDAGPEVDAAWSSLGVDYRSVLVPAAQAEKSGILPDQVKISKKYGGGYPANVEGLHHLHCLNLLRKALYYNFEHYHSLGEGAFGNSDQILRYHVSHCLDILRQQLICTVDTGVFGQIWWNPKAPEAFVDFNTRHKCKNFDAIRQWTEDHQLPKEVPSDFLEPPKEGYLESFRTAKVNPTYRYYPKGCGGLSRGGLDQRASVQVRVSAGLDKAAKQLVSVGGGSLNAPYAFDNL